MDLVSRKDPGSTRTPVMVSTNGAGPAGAGSVTGSAPSVSARKSITLRAGTIAWPKSVAPSMKNVTGTISTAA